jgi:hypothetical protein
MDSPQPSGGTKVERAGGDRTLAIMGVHYTAAAPTPIAEKLGDHTLSTKNALMINVSGTVSREVTGTVIVQHNLAKYTANAEFSAVTYDEDKCGCLPVSGSITTTLSGSRTGTETLTISACGEDRSRTTRRRSRRWCSTAACEPVNFR